MRLRQGHDAVAEGAVEFVDRVGRAGRRADEGLDGRKRVLHPMMQLANEQRLALLGQLALGQEGLRLALALARPQGRAHDVSQRARMERPLQNVVTLPRSSGMRKSRMPSRNVRRTNGKSDQGGWRSIHSARKRQVGPRAGLSATMAAPASSAATS